MRSCSARRAPKEAPRHYNELHHIIVVPQESEDDNDDNDDDNDLDDNEDDLDYDLDDDKADLDDDYYPDDDKDYIEAVVTRWLKRMFGQSLIPGCILYLIRDIVVVPKQRVRKSSSFEDILPSNLKQL